MREAGSFWARRRAAVQAEAEADRRAEEGAAQQAREAALAERDDTEILQELGLPDPLSLQKGDDFSAFMAREVPERLRRQALRTLWRSNPVLACLDGLNDYEDDYRAAALSQAPFKTAYQVGKGLTKHVEELERLARMEAEAAQAPEEDASHPDAEISERSVPLQDETEPTAGTTMAAATSAGAEAEESPVALRRMRFRFAEASA